MHRFFADQNALSADRKSSINQALARGTGQALPIRIGVGDESRL
jgi:hypothetical protein